MSSSRGFLSKPASLHQLSYRRYGKGTWLAPDWQWNFKCQGLGFGFVLGSLQKCLSFEVTESDACFQEIILEALCCLLKPHSPILSLCSWWFLTQVQEITFVHAHSSLPFSISLAALLHSHTCVHAHTPLIWMGGIICRRLIWAGFLPCSHWLMTAVTRVSHITWTVMEQGGDAEKQDNPFTNTLDSHLFPATWFVTSVSNFRGTGNFCSFSFN